MGETKNITTDFTRYVSLKMLIQFFEDNKTILVKVKQELVLFRSSSSLNAIFRDYATEIRLETTSIHSRVAHLTVHDAYRLNNYYKIERESSVPILGCYENLTLPQTNQLAWADKTANQLAGKTTMRYFGFPNVQKV